MTKGWQTTCGAGNQCKSWYHIHYCYKRTNLGLDLLFLNLRLTYPLFHKNDMEGWLHTVLCVCLKRLWHHVLIMSNFSCFGGFLFCFYIISAQEKVHVTRNVFHIENMNLWLTVSWKYQTWQALLDISIRPSTLGSYFGYGTQWVT